jgi:hypothetical protein
MNKPPLTMKLFTWMLLKANRKNGYRGLSRGQFFTTISDMQEAMSWYIGYRKVTPSVQEIRSSYEALKVNTMINTTKTTRGMLVTILNYEHYQDPKNYEEHREQRNDSATKPSTPTHDKQEGVRSTRIEPPCSPEPANEYSSEFLEFWKHYPKKKAKGAAWKAWKKIKRPVETLVKIQTALLWQKKSKDWTKEGGQFIPYPATYLNAKGWEDEPETKTCGTKTTPDWL